MSREESAATSCPSEGEMSSPSASEQPKKKSSKSSKARLTSAQKNTNHRDAENKRRDGIRTQFENLADMVPGCEGMAKSEQFVLTKTAEYLEESLAHCRRMVAELDRKGIPVPEKYRAMLTENDFGGSNHQTPAMDEYESKKQRAEARKGSGAQRTDRELEDDDDDEA